MILAGSKDYWVRGTIYVPNTSLSFMGNADLDVDSQGGYLIARTFSYTGNSSLTFNAQDGYVPDAFSGGPALVN